MPSPAPRDIYAHDVDFAALALQDPAFAKKLKPNKQLDFSDPESVMQLTKSLLRRDFDLEIELPSDRLCPPVPNRFNYILWLQDLLDSTSPDYRESYDPKREVLGIDIGTGASCIYPLLATRQRPGWKLLATEIDAKSFEYANRNVERNGLMDRIKVLKTHEEEGDGALVPVEVLERLERLDLLLTNPPFYPSPHSLLASSTLKSRPPNSVCTGSPSEMITPGGEVGFLNRLITQSADPDVKGKIQWWSSMLGKLSSVGTVVERLRSQGCGNWAVTEFVQGQRTRRWGIAWSWGGLRPGVRVARGVGGRGLKGGRRADGKEEEEGLSLEGGLLPFPSEFEFGVHGSVVVDVDADEVGRRVDSEIRSLDLQWQWRDALGTGLGIARNGDCWSRKARRKKSKSRSKRRRNEPALKQRGDGIEAEDEDDDMQQDDEDETSGEEKEPELVFKIQVRCITHTEGKEENMLKGDGDGEGARILVKVRWLQGHDHVLFESFCGWLKRKIDLERR